MISGDAINPHVISINRDSGKPSEFNLGMAYPNPFNPTTTMDYQLTESGIVNISIYDLKGSLVKELVNEYKPYGSYEVIWSAENHASGVYFAQIKINGFVQNKK